MKTRWLPSLFATAILVCSVGWSERALRADPAPAPVSRLKVSEDRRFLTMADGKPFFWLGDTAWWLRLIPPENVARYMAHRARQRFNVLQVHCGYAVVDYGDHRPFLDNDTDKPEEAFWRTMDALVAQALDNRLYIALTPLWGDEYGKAFGKDAAKAARFGRWIGKRYASRPHVLWIVSGEYDSINGYRPVTAEQKTLFTALAEGLRQEHHGAQLMTLHPGSARTSSKDFHEVPWLDFNMLQSGHMNDCSAYGKPENYEMVTSDWSLEPVKPVLDGEPIYEDTPDGIFARGNINGPRADAAAVRRKAYWAVFAGACGHTYGHNDVYGFYVPAHPGEAENFAWGKGSGRRGHWKDALDAPGAIQMQYVRALMESRPIPGRIPDPTLVIGDPLKGLNHIAATRASDGSYAMIYLPFGKPVHIRTDKISERAIRCWWFDPRTGNARPAGEHAAQAEVEFQPPSAEDWVLVLDDAAKNYPPPGRP